MRSCMQMAEEDGNTGSWGGPPPEGGTPKPSATDANSEPFTSNSRVSSATQSCGIFGVLTTLPQFLTCKIGMTIVVTI